jgi:hypothetical protein
MVVQQEFEHWLGLDERMRWCDQQVGAHVRSSPAAKINGIGEIGASALTAGVGDFKQFKSGHQFGVWLGVVPSQNSSGGKTSLGRLTTRSADLGQRVPGPHHRLPTRPELFGHCRDGLARLQPLEHRKGLSLRQARWPAQLLSL